VARIRTIKPEFWKHPVMCRLPDDFQLLALSLLSMADDEGYFHADPSIVRGEVMPFRESLARIREGLETLQEKGWIELADHPEQGLIGRIAKWGRHQKVDHPSPSKLKDYFTRASIANPREEHSKPRESLALDQGSGIKEQGTGRRLHRKLPRRNRRMTSKRHRPIFTHCNTPAGCCRTLACPKRRAIAPS
jgi:hypothetical protein